MLRLLLYLCTAQESSPVSQFIWIPSNSPSIWASPEFTTVYLHSDWGRDSLLDTNILDVCQLGISNARPLMLFITGKSLEDFFL